MDEQQGQFLKAIYAVQNEIGRARVLDIASHLGLDIINSKAERYLYHETTLELRESGYIESLAMDEWVTCGIVRLTAEGLNYVESKKTQGEVLLMSHRTLQRITFDRHAKEQPRCEVIHTLTGGYCEKLGTQRTIDGLLCEQHARLFGLEERIACWEAILLHIELWSKVARRRDREDIVRLLQFERAEAAAALARAHEDLEKAENEGYERKEREIYGFMSGGIS